ncbi:MAG: hypothetical protein J6P28_01045, partial [Treponema sp.]|nr:hypothetical protein [Treponema sp.]
CNFHYNRRLKTFLFWGIIFYSLPTSEFCPDFCGTCLVKANTKKRTSCHFLLVQQAAPWRARQMFAQKFAGFCKKTRAKKWQGGHF